MTKFLLCTLIVFLSIGCWHGRHKELDFASPPPAQELYAKAMELYERNNLIDSYQMFQACRTRYPITEWGINAALKMADCLYYQEQYENALVQYQEFSRLHPTNQFIDYAYYQMGMCYYRQLCKIDRDQTSSAEVVKHFERLLSLFPASAYAPSAQEKITEAKKRLANHVLSIADYYYRTGAYLSALHRYRQALTEYSDQLSEPDRVLFQLGKAYLHIEQPDNARVQFATLIANYPESPLVSPSETLLENPAALPDMEESSVSQLFGKLNPLRTLPSFGDKEVKDLEAPAEGE
jgi:outer membrane protein assembly factor BamD